MERKPTLCLDFDGVIHSYTSGWKGAKKIPDSIVSGALDFITKAMQEFTVAIYSSRSGQYGGIRAMKTWLRKRMKEVATLQVSTPPELKKFVFTYGVGPCTLVIKSSDWDRAVDKASYCLIHFIEWPKFKPPAKISLDDRAICFKGIFPSVEELLSFKTWQER